MKRITRDNVSEELLKEMAEHHGGYLGSYTREEYDALVTFETPNWKFIWTPFNMDVSVGKVTLVGTARESVMQLDIGRSRAILRRHPKMSRYHALGLIMALKRRRFGLLPMVQDFLIEHAGKAELQALTESESAGDLKRWLKQNGYGHFREELIQQLPGLIEKAAATLAKPLPERHQPKGEQKPTRKPNGQRRRDGKPSYKRDQTPVAAAVDESPVVASEPPQA